MTAVLDDPDEIAAAFRGTLLEGLPIEEGLGDTWVVTGLDSGRLLSAWRVARSAIGTTGRWPVLTALDEQWQDPDELPADVTVDPWTVYRWWGADALIAPDELHLWLPDFLTTEPASAPQPLLAVERRTWERLLADPAALAAARRRASRPGHWFTPPGGAQLVLLPTATQWLAPTWFDYHGALAVQPGDLGRTALAAAIRQWDQQWGAELVASWGTMLQFVAARRPAVGEEAWGLALQQLAVGGSLQAAPWELALSLTQTDIWFLHDRP